ncbi:MAG TPA: DNA repair protein RecN, partial [Vampirovibrionales bacterium]
MSLVELKATNYLFIESLDLSFSDGFNVITGETGAGKSVVLDVIKSLVSTRLSKEVIRKGSNKSYLEGTFHSSETINNWLNKNDIDPLDEEGFIGVAREISEKGSKARINGVLVQAKLMQELGELLIEVHGQNSQLQLLTSAKQLLLIDEYCKQQNKIFEEDLKNYKQDYFNWKQKAQELEEGKNTIVERERELDYTNFQLNEIDALEITDETEEEVLTQKINKSANASDLYKIVEGFEYELLEADSNLLSILNKTSRDLSAYAKDDEVLTPYAQGLSEAAENILEIVRELKSYSESFENDEQDLDAMNARLNKLQKLKRKHNFKTLKELITYREELAERKDFLENLSGNLEALEKETKALKIKLQSQAEKLHAVRQDAAQNLSETITKELPSLAMPEAKLKINCSLLDELNSNGFSKIEFLFQANKGDEPKPLAKVASGGELSRVLLLLKIAVGSGNTIIFDEIDAGTSGKVSQLMGEKLALLAQKNQVLCVTHQPTVAAYAQSHYLVSKEHGAEITTINTTILNSEQEKVDALIDLMTGEKDKILAQEYAKQLLLQSSLAKPLNNKV